MRRQMLPISAICAGIISATSVVFALPPISIAEIRQPSDPRGYVASGLTAGEETGWQVSFIPDINGDGISELLLDAPKASPLGRANAGQAYVVFGKTDGSISDLAKVEANQGGFVIRGSEEAAGAAFRHLSGVGDFNGDGVDDILYQWSKIGPPASGFAHVIYGKSDPGFIDVTKLEEGASDLGFSFKTDEDSPFYATPVGDFNGDGLADICVLDLGTADANESFIVFGNAQQGILQPSDIRADKGGIIVTLPDHNGSFVAGAGDVNGDGFDDVIYGILTPPPDEQKAEFYVLHGRPGNNSLNIANEAAGGTGNRIFSSAASGIVECAGVGDVNGDGLDDVMVFTPYTFGVSPAHVVVFGRTSGGNIDLDSIIAQEGGGFRFDAIWTAFAAAGDVDGDGLGDMVGGYPYIDDAEGTVVSGKTTFTPITWPNMIDNGSGSFRTAPDQTKDERHGWAVSSAGDMNLDGLADIIIGAPLADTPGGEDAGEVFVVFSPVTPKPATRRYKTAIKSGNAPWRGIGMTNNAIQGTPFSHVWLRYNGGHGPADSNAPSFVTATGPLPTDGLSNLPANVSNVAWGVVDERDESTSGSIRIRYMDSHVPGAQEENLRIYRSPGVSGPWELLESQSVEAERNIITGSRMAVNMAGIYVLAEPPAITAGDVVDAVLGRVPIENLHDANSDKVVDAADAVHLNQ